MRADSAATDEIVEPVLNADIEHVLAHEENDEEGGHDLNDEGEEEPGEEEEENECPDDAQAIDDPDSFLDDL